MVDPAYRYDYLNSQTGVDISSTTACQLGQPPTYFHPGTNNVYYCMLAHYYFSFMMIEMPGRRSGRVRPCS